VTQVFEKQREIRREIEQEGGKDDLLGNLPVFLFSISGFFAVAWLRNAYVAPDLPPSPLPFS
jgi:hypothetical protein